MKLEAETGQSTNATGNRLLAEILAGGNDDATYELLQAFFEGYPLDRLRLLLTSEHDWAVDAGAWIASELGSAVAPLVDDLVVLLKHPSAAIRFHAVDGIFGSAGKDRGDVLAEGVRLIDDPDRGIRWRVMDSLARADRTQLLAGASYLDGSQYPLLMMLRGDSHGVAEMVAAGSDREKRFAAATAARLALQGDSSSLAHIADCDSSEIRQFVSDVVQHLRIAGGDSM